MKAIEGVIIAAKADLNGDTMAAAIASFNHVPGGANVLFMDGHVEFLKYTGPGNDAKFPVVTYTAPYSTKIIE